MVHYVDVHLPWSHSLCACCLPRMLRPAPPVAFQISGLASLRKHLQQPVSASMPPFRFGHKPPRFITAYSATVPLSAPPLPGAAAASAAAEERAAAPSVVQQYRRATCRPATGPPGSQAPAGGSSGMHDIAAARAAAAFGARGTRAAGSPRLWWCCWLCSDCWTRYRRAVSIAAFTVLVAKFPRFVTLWRAPMRSANLIFPRLAFQFGAGRHAGGDCLASLLLQVLGVKGKQQLETGFAAHLLPLLPGGRDAHGEGGEGGESRGREGGEGEEWRKGWRGVEWEEYVQRVGEIAAQGGLAGEQYRCCCSQCEFALKSATLFCQPPFACAAALIFSDCAGSRHKERVEDAAVEEALDQLVARERRTEGSGVQDRGKRAMESDAPATDPAATAAGSTAARNGSNTASGTGAKLVLVNSNMVVALFTYRVSRLLQWVRFYGPRVNPAEDCRCFNQRGYATALPHPLHDLPNLLQRFGVVPKLPATTGEEGLARTVWEEFPEGDRAAMAEEENDPARKFFGCSTFHVGAFRGGGSELDKEEMQKEYNVREFYPPLAHVDSFTVRSHHLPGGKITVQVNTSGPVFPTLGHRVEEFLRRFAPARLAREGRNGPLARAITSWAGRSGLRDHAWAALALGKYSHGRIKPILWSEAEVDVSIKLISNAISPIPACSRGHRCICMYYLAVNYTSLVATFAYRPSSALLRCLLSLFPARSSRFRELLENLGVAPVPAVVPDSLVAALLEGVMEEHRLMLLYMRTLLLTKENALPAILEPVSTDAGGQVEGEKQQQQQQQQQGEEEWRMWEEVDIWRMAAGNAWPAMEAHDSPLQMRAGKRVGRVQGEVSEECCEGMRRAIKDAGKGQKGRTGAWYLVPWPGGLNPLACLREMLLGETSYCPQAHVDAVSAAAAGGAAAAAAAGPGEGRSGKGGQRGCVSAQCGSEGGP
ncbi:unnamed protein product [Closterium sp. Naga37s-1]|nr:unnamed protein product [Closterium sp. Naga37s-1]